MNAFPRPLLAAGLLMACVSAPAQDQPIYKCGQRTYTHVPCTGGEALGSQRVSKSFEPPNTQDRARRMARAQLPPEAQAQCAALEKSIKEEEARQRASTAPPTEREEGDLAILRVRFREMRC